MLFNGLMGSLNTQAALLFIYSFVMVQIFPLYASECPNLD